MAAPNYAPLYARRRRRVKTDRRDAEALAHACRLGAYHPAHRTSRSASGMCAVLAVREALVRSRTRWISVVRALVRQHGYRLRSGAAESFLSRVAALELSAELQAAIEPVLRAMQSVNKQLPAFCATKEARHGG